jgi:hypothetical protein
MALIIEQISPTRIWIHDGSTSLLDIDTSAGVRIDSALQIGANTVGGTLGNYVATTSSAKKFVAGVHTTASATDTKVTGLTTVIACGATFQTDPADANFLVSATIGDQAGAPAAGSIIINTWKTDGTDPTPVAASSFSKVVNWWAYGT